MRRSFILICVALLLSVFANAQTYDITVNITGNGTVTYADEAVENAEVITVDENATPAFTITPADGNRLVSVMLDGETNVTNDLVGNVYTFATVTEDHTLAVTFEEIPATTYTITLTVGEHGTVYYNDEAVSTSVTVNENAEPAFTITPETGYRVASVIVDGGTNVTTELVANVYTFAAVTDNHSLAVTFEEIPAVTYTITLTVGEHGTVYYNDEAVSTSVTVNENATPSFTFTPETGYRVASVMLDGETNVTTELVANVYTFAAVTDNHSLAVTFEEDNITPVETMFGITFEGLAEGDMIVVPVTVDSSYVHTAEVVDSVETGSDFVFALRLAECHQIASVVVNEEELVADGEGYYTLANVVSDTTISIEYAEVKYNLTISAGEHGSVAVESAEVDCGSSYTVAFVPNSGYRLSSVLLDGETTTEGISGNNYTLTVLADHTIEGVYTAEVGPYFEFVNLAENYQVGDSVEFAIKVHSNGSIDNLCSVEYKMSYSSNDGQSYMNLSDLSRYGIFSYDVRGEGANVLNIPITRGSGTFSSDVDYHGSTYSISAFTLGMFDNDCVDRNRPVDFDMLFTKSGLYKFKITLNTCSNPGETLGSTFVAENCDGMTHYDRYANTCTGKTVYKEYEFIMDVEGANVCTVTTSVPAGHGTISPEGTTVVTAGQDLELTFTPDENYELDSLFVNGIMTYPTLDGTESVVDNHYTLTNIRNNQKVVAKFRDVRPYYNIHVEIETAGGTVTPSDTTVVVGSDVTLNIRPNDGFHISQLEIDGNIVIDYASSEIVFTNVNSDHHIKISFFPNSVEENMFANLSIYPNPNNGQFTVSSDDFDGDVTFQIFSVSGAMMDERMVNGQKTVSFDKSLPAGTYFLRIIAGEKVATRKLVVE
ncbi:MAG: T9SS type A sorting domain-containing protein [Bacteroidales bacterium]|nr:T9SS type A sorting domain-containing protein [Bacteroidales bacterium]